MTNIVIATVVLLTNKVESLHPSGNIKTVVETVSANVFVPIVITNQPVIVTNIPVVLSSKTNTYIWTEIGRSGRPILPPFVPLKREPLTIKDENK